MPEGTSAFHGFTIYIHIGPIANLYLLHTDLFFSLVLPVIFPELLTSGQLYYSDVMILSNLYIILEQFLKL